MSSDIILDVNEVDFEFEVIAYSKNTPVVVDFWAPWCRPCRTLSPLLEKLTREAAGSFRLARVDVDQNPNLAARFGVRTIPTVTAFSDGHPAGEMVGNQPESRVRDFLAKIAPPSPLSLAIEKAWGILADQAWVEAEKQFRQLLEQEHDHPSCLLGLAIALLAQNKPEESRLILKAFPASREYNQAILLLPYADELINLKEGRLINENDLDAAFQASMRLASQAKFLSALDGLLDILRQDKRYRLGKAQQVVIAILEIIGPDDTQSRAYRSELASVLY
jgi:putative thioredoxin